MAGPHAKLATVAYIAAFIVAGLYVVAFLLSPPTAALFVAVFLTGGVGILRHRSWSAYGLAMVIASQLLVLGIGLLRSAGSDTSPSQIAIGVLFNLLLIVLFWFTGRSLTKANAAQGRARPWVVLAVVVFVPFIFVQPFVIPSGSMEDTLLIGDQILALRFPHTLPQRGDIIVFCYPVDHKQIEVKRVIGVAGDRIKITAKRVFRNGAALDESYARHYTEDIEPYRDNFPSEPDVRLLPTAAQMLRDSVQGGEVVVPSGRYFVLGDNRDNSFDSRYWGFVESSDVLGKPLMIYFSKETTPGEAEGKEQSVPTLPHVRWNRLFKRP